MRVDFALVRAYADVHRDMYRVNYGNGQVSNTFTSLNAARQELARLSCGYAYVQRYIGDGEWRRVR